MVTPELTEYIRGEFAKGRTREEIRSDLVAGGKWGEADLIEAFKTVTPMQGFFAPNIAVENTDTTPATPVAPPIIDKPIIETPAVIEKPVIEEPIPVIEKPAIEKPIIAKEDIAEADLPKEDTPKTDLLKEEASPNPFWQKQNLAFVVAVLVCITTLYFAGSQMINFWSSGSMNNANDLSKDAVPPEETDIASQDIPARDCGITKRPDLKNPLSYENNTVLNCMGDSALSCVDAKAVLKDDLFPTVFEIVRDKNASQNMGQNACSFKISYPEDSALVDSIGRKLALQYISCPISIAKAVDESNPKAPIFKVPSYNNLSKYASQIYYYGIIGVFIENDVDQNKILNLGCDGEYISFLIASYQKMQYNNK